MTSGVDIEPPPSAAASSAPPDPLPSLAWLLALPCAAITIALVALLGPPLSRVLYPAQLPFTLLPNVVAKPEPVEGTRCVLSLAAPVLLVACVVLAAKRALRATRTTRALAGAAQLLAAGVVVACVARQLEPGWRLGFFRTWQLLAAPLIAVAIGFAAQRGRLTRRMPESRALRIAVPALALLLTAAWFLSFVNTDRSIWWSGDPYNSGFQFDETLALINGLTPLAGFQPSYGALTPFLLAPWMLLLGRTMLAFSCAMWLLSIVTMLAIYGVFRRVTGSSLAALGLFLPVMAFSFFAAVRDVHHPLAIFQEMPLRNLGPFLLAWLTARRLDARGRATWPLLLAAGLVTLNNVEFGVAALAATVAARLWTTAPLGGRTALRVVGEAAAGLLGAYALFAALTLVVAGALPDPVSALVFDRIFGIGGVGLNPLPHVIGLPLVVYLTYAAALAVATVRALRRAPNGVLTGMLAWSAIFGFGSGAYYMGESVANGIPTTFPPWSFALALLTVVAVERIAARPRRLPSLAAVAALLGFGLVATFALDPPASILPWRQIASIRHDGLTPRLAAFRAVGTPLAAPREADVAQFVTAVPDAHGGLAPRRGAAVALFWSTGHAIADAYGMRDVVPYIPESLFTVEQLDDALDRLRDAGGSVVLMPTLTLGRAAQALAERGFAVLTRTGFRSGVPGQSFPAEELVVVHGLTKWVDRRALR